MSTKFMLERQMKKLKNLRLNQLLLGPNLQY